MRFGPRRQAQPRLVGPLLRGRPVDVPGEAHPDRLCSRRRLGFSVSNSRSIPHLPALDGLRGLAVLGVVLFHASGFLPGGYLGVDLFFVLSGYLITSILLSEHQARRSLDLARFWIRRARRLFPALLSVLLAMGLYARFVAKPSELATLRSDSLATLFYVANWHAIFAERDYWDLFLSASPLEHTWSLAIEEQFYVLWPLVVAGILVVGRRSTRCLAAVSLGLALASAAAMWWLYDPESTARAYLGTDTRAAGILLGAALACVFGPGRVVEGVWLRLLDGAGLLGMLGLAAAWLWLSGENPFLYRGGFFLTELCALVVIACGTQGSRSLVARLLSTRPLVLLGTISYGVYLWHWPINCVLGPERFSDHPFLMHTARAVLLLLVATLSYRFYEKPIRSRGIFFGRPALIVPSAVGACLAVLFVSTRPRAETAPSFLPPSPPVPSSAASTPEPWGIFSVPFTSFPPRGAAPREAPRILVLGDSVANKLGWALRYRQDEFGVFVAERGVGNCSILTDAGSAGLLARSQKSGNNCAKTWGADVRELSPDLTFIVLGGGFFTRAKLEGKYRRACERGWRESYTARLETLVEELRPNAGRIVLAVIPYPVGRWRTSGTLQRVDCFNATIRAFAAAHELPIVDLMQKLCPTTDCQLMSEGEPIRPDGLHFDGRGAEDTARFTLRELKRLLEPSAATPSTNPRPTGPLSAEIWP